MLRYLIKLQIWNYNSWKNVFSILPSKVVLVLEFVFSLLTYILTWLKLISGELILSNSVCFFKNTFLFVSFVWYFIYFSAFSSDFIGIILLYPIRRKPRTRLATICTSSASVYVRSQTPNINSYFVQYQIKGWRMKVM